MIARLRPSWRDTHRRRHYGRGLNLRRRWNDWWGICPLVGAVPVALVLRVAVLVALGLHA